MVYHGDPIYISYLYDQMWLVGKRFDFVFDKNSLYMSHTAPFDNHSLSLTYTAVIKNIKFHSNYSKTFL